MNRWRWVVLVVIVAACVAVPAGTFFLARSFLRRALVQGLSGSGPHPLEGRPAPSFRARALDGTAVDMAEHLGRDVVMLDFWATWCPPCRAALPEVTALATRYADKGLVFYAVNQGEAPQEIRAFLEEAGLQMPVLLDPDGSVGDRYGVRAIPQTVIIGRDGTVRRVHVGYMPGLEAALGTELEAALAGTPAAEPTVPHTP